MILRYTMCNKKEYQWSSSQHNEIDIDRFACNSLGATRTKHDTLIRKKELAHEIIICSLELIDVVQALNPCWQRVPQFNTPR